MNSHTEQCAQLQDLATSTYLRTLELFQFQDLMKSNEIAQIRIDFPRKPAECSKGPVDDLFSGLIKYISSKWSDLLNCSHNFSTLFSLN